MDIASDKHVFALDITVSHCEVGSAFSKQHSLLLPTFPVPLNVGTGSSVVAADVMWSDPIALPGLDANVERSVGLIFGPDITQVSALPRLFLERERGTSFRREENGSQ